MPLCTQAENKDITAEEKAIILNMLQSSYRKGQAASGEKEALLLHLQDRACTEALDIEQMKACVKQLISLYEDIRRYRAQVVGIQTQKPADYYKTLFKAIFRSYPGISRQIDLWSAVEESSREAKNQAAAKEIIPIYIDTWAQRAGNYDGRFKNIGDAYLAAGDILQANTLYIADITLLGQAGKAAAGIAHVRQIIERADADIQAAKDTLPSGNGIDIPAIISKLATPAYLKEELVLQFLQERLLCLQQEEKYDQCLSILLPIMEYIKKLNNSGDNGEALINLQLIFADIQRQKEAWDIAIPIYTAVVTGREPAPESAVWGLAESHYVRQNHAEAGKYYEKYLFWYPQGDKAEYARLRQGIIALRQNDTAGGELILYPLTKKSSPVSVQARLELAQTMSAGHRQDEAFEQAFQAFAQSQREEDQLKAASLMSESYTGSKGQKENLMEVLQAAVSILNRTADSRNLIDMNSSPEDYQLSEEHFNLYHQMSTLWAKEKKYAEARSLLAGHRYDPRLYDRYVDITIKSGSYGEAIEYLNNLIQLRPQAAANSSQKIIDILLQSAKAGNDIQLEETLDAALAARDNLAANKREQAAYDSALTGIYLKWLKNASVKGNYNQIAIRHSSWPIQIAPGDSREAFISKIVQEAHEAVIKEQMNQARTQADNGEYGGALCNLRRLLHAGIPKKRVEEIAVAIVDISNKAVSASLPTHMASQKDKDYKAGIVRCQEIIRQYPESTQTDYVNLMQADMLRLSGKTAAAMEIYEQIAARESTASYQARLQVARACLKDNPDKAQSYLQTSLPHLDKRQVLPSDLLFAGRQSINKKNYHNGTGYLQRLIRDYPQSSEAMEAVKIIDAYLREG
jgi:outer membrane protein assembly factor BamD (BamD/ComL family)